MLARLLVRSWPVLLAKVGEIGARKILVEAVRDGQGRLWLCDVDHYGRGTRVLELLQWGGDGALRLMSEIKPRAG